MSDPILPSDIALSVRELNQVFQSFALYAVGLGGAKEAWDAWDQGGRDGAEPQNPYGRVRVSWPTAGAPAWGIDEDIIFLQATEADGSYNRQRDVRTLPYSEHQCDYESRYTRIINVAWVLYGPNSFSDAQALRDYAFHPLQHSAWWVKNLFLIPDMVAPRRVPEIFQGRWWERVDLAMQFNELIVRNVAINYIESAEVTIRADILDATEVVIITEDSKPH